MMQEKTPGIVVLDLQGKLPGGASIKLLQAEIPAIEDPRFALIRYSVNGKRTETGLRLDLDKQTLLDHFEVDSAKEKFLRGVTPRLVQLLYAELEKRQGYKPDYG